MRINRLTAFAAGAVLALAVTGGTAAAANGYKLVIGHSNKASAVTTLSNSKGTALKLNSKRGKAPLAVNSTTRVTHLNADTVDGVDSSSLARTTGRSGSFDVAGTLADTDKNGKPDAILAEASCPAGTQMTGGGVTDTTTTGVVVSNAPNSDGGESWVAAVSIEEGSADVGSDVTASVVCYNPLGAVSGSYRRPQHRVSIDPAVRAKLRHLAVTR